MIETTDVKLHTWTCDVPGCTAIKEVADTYGTGPYGPANWNVVKLTDTERLTLCPDHPGYATIIRTVLLALNRRESREGEGHDTQARR